MKIKPIEWGEVSKPDGVTCFYDHLKGKMPLGEYSIEWKSWKDYDPYTIYFNGEFIGAEYDLESAKSYAECHYGNLLSSCLESIKPNGRIDIHRHLIDAISGLNRYDYGYISDGDNRYLGTKVTEDGPFLRRGEVMKIVDELLSIKFY